MASISTKFRFLIMTAMQAPRVIYLAYLIETEMFT